MMTIQDALEEARKIEAYNYTKQDVEAFIVKAKRFFKVESCMCESSVRKLQGKSLLCLTCGHKFRIYWNRKI